MGKTIEISVQNRVAWQTNSVDYICANGDFIAKFNFDEEWDGIEAKTARFIHGGDYTDVVFSGSECEVPFIMDVKRMEVGVYAGNLYTTTPALVHCRRSARCGGGVQADPTPDVYAQLMELLNNGGSGTGGTSNIFIAEYGKTTNAEIFSAYEDGKACFVKHNYSVFPSTMIMKSRAYFSGVSSNGTFFIVDCFSDVWSRLNIPKVETISGESTHEEYPSAKAVYDYVSANGENVDLSGYVKSVNGNTPDENGNVQITAPDSGGNVDLTIEGETLVIAENSTATIDGETLIL